MKKALIVYGGWEGHYPVPLSELFGGWLTEAGFDVTKSDSLDAFAKAEELKTYDLIVPIWTMGEIPNEYAENVSQAVCWRWCSTRWLRDSCPKARTSWSGC